MTQVQCVLYETSHCHLCELAQQVLMPFVQNQMCTVELIDIAEEAAVMERYATRIPVLYHAASQRELGWPFDETDVHRFLQACQS